MNSLDTALSNYDLSHLMSEVDNGTAHIIDDTQITSKTDIKQLFGTHDYVILFHKWPKKRIGHWVVLTKSGRNLFYFDSLGDMYSPVLIDLCKKQGYNLFVNDIQFQPDNTNMCGRWALLSIASNRLGLSPYQFIEILKREKRNVNKFLVKEIR